MGRSFFFPWLLFFLLYGVFASFLYLSFLHLEKEYRTTKIKERVEEGGVLRTVPREKSYSPLVTFPEGGISFSEEGYRVDLKDLSYLLPFYHPPSLLPWFFVSLLLLTFFLFLVTIGFFYLSLRPLRKMASLPPGAGVKELSQALTETVEELRSSYRRLESAYEELKKAQEELLKAEQWKTLAYFAGGVAHELGNPLSAVVQYWEWIQNEPDRISPSLLSSIGEELYRMERMITALRYISRPSQIPWEEVDLKEIVVKVLKVFFRSYPDLSVEERVPSVRLVTFPPMLEVVLRNLIGNGIKVQESPRLTLLGEVKEGRVVLTIRDFGPGFPPSFSPEPFHSTGEGMGFGIPLSIRLLEVLGGSLLFQNHKEGGEVVITLPFSPSGKRER